MKNKKVSSMSMNVRKILKKVYHVLRGDRSTKILKDEIRYAANKLSENDLNFLTYSIRMQIHGFEKVMVKGGRNVSPVAVEELLKKAQKVLDVYPDYPHDGDLIAETLGIIECLQQNVENPKYISQIKEAFIEKNALGNVIIRPIVISHIRKDELALQNFNEYESFVRSRHSIREFTDERVDFQTVEKIVEIAQICPSECNRQTCKVYYSMGDAISAYKPDPNVGRDIHNYLILTVNKCMYSTGEVLQPWIDGGIFLESLIMAIHSFGLGSCPFQQIKGTTKYDSIKKLAHIPDNEDIVALLGFGKLKDEYSVIGTHRKSVSEVLTKY